MAISLSDASLFGFLPARKGGAPHTSYRLFGLEVRSQVPLVDLAAATPTGSPDVEILCEEPTEQIGSTGIHMAGESMILQVAGTARYTVSGGRTVRVQPVIGASERNIRLFLMGSVFGAVLHQRGMLPLHANAIDMGGWAIAFVGHSGSGKSTIAAWFASRGKRVLADDVCVVGHAADGRPEARAGMPRLRLWRDALEQRGRDAADYERSFEGMEKYDVPNDASSGPEHVPIIAIYRLGRSQPDDPNVQIKRLAGVEAINTLVANTYRGEYLQRIGGIGRHLESCVAVARTVPIYTANRAWGYDRFENEARRLEAHAAATARQKQYPSDL